MLKKFLWYVMNACCRRLLISLDDQSSAEHRSNVAFLNKVSSVFYLLSSMFFEILRKLANLVACL